MTTPEQRREELVKLYREVSSCARCPLSQTRTQTVFGAGNANADLMFVGEAPGAQEDLQGIPFVGRAGKLLDELLAENGLDRGDVFIANVLKSRPPANRDPEPGEIEACKPYLYRQVELIEPTVICTLGNFATKLLTRSNTGISRVHGAPQVHKVGGRSVQIFPIFHPAAGLRTPRVKEQLREDLAKLPALLAAGPPPQEPVAPVYSTPEEPPPPPQPTLFPE
ncbi:MAG TPA: uracil-DNA glycosylase [Thermoleophilaceae bacterium]|nr:uracil-DNA glycosylase [Thermoleophilaceae bacterium]